jgi:hypothetical protein
MRNIIITLLVPLLSLGCGITYNFQVYNIEQLNEHQVSSDTSEKIEVENDFWSNGGNTSLRIYNKTNTLVNIDLRNSFIIINGTSTSLYKLNMMDEILGIAPYSNSILFIKSTIRDSFYSDCFCDSFKLTKYGKREFNLNNTPNKFYYYLSGSTLAGDTFEYISQTFYISQLLTLEQKDFFDYEYTLECGKKSDYPQLTIPLKSVNRFYLVNKVGPKGYQ